MFLQNIPFSFIKNSIQNPIILQAWPVISDSLSPETLTLLQEDISVWVLLQFRVVPKGKYTWKDVYLMNKLESRD